MLQSLQYDIKAPFTLKSLNAETSVFQKEIITLNTGMPLEYVLQLSLCRQIVLLSLCSTLTVKQPFFCMSVQDHNCMFYFTDSITRKYKYYNLSLKKCFQVIMEDLFEAKKRIQWI